MVKSLIGKYFPFHHLRSKERIVFSETGGLVGIYQCERFLGLVFSIHCSSPMTEPPHRYARTERREDPKSKDVKWLIIEKEIGT